MFFTSEYYLQLIYFGKSQINTQFFLDGSNIFLMWTGRGMGWGGYNGQLFLPNQAS
jgi:hypothetical protein